MRALPVLAVVLALIMSAAAVWQITESPDSVDDIGPTPAAVPTPGEPVAVSVEAGLSPREIGEALESVGAIDSATQFRILVSLLGYDSLLQAGDYEFERGTPALEAIYRMRRGIISSRFVTVIEGWRLEQVADALEEKGVSRADFLGAARPADYDFEFLQGLDPEATLEGYLFPATYYFRRSNTAREIVGQMLQAFDQKVKAELRAAAADAGLTLHQVVTLASIIEREAQVAEERPIMAQVFLKRLRLGIALEADPTVQYAVGSDPQNAAQYGYWKQELTREDLETDSPYNTYRVGGFPPGPIANPGLAAIEAVVHPANTNYLFFVAKPDGSHAFAETQEEHQQNVDRYQRGGEGTPQP